MSVESMAIALHHSRATGAAKIILIGIANHDGDGGAWPSIATLAKYGNVTPRAAQKAIEKLIALGEIHRHIQQGGTLHTPNHARPNRYTFTLVCPPGCDRTSAHRVRPVDNDAGKGVNHRTGGEPQDRGGGEPQDTLTVLRTGLDIGHSPSPNVTTDAGPVDSASDVCHECGGEVDLEAPAEVALGLCRTHYGQAQTRRKYGGDR